jgi:hypothetical protein
VTPVRANRSLKNNRLAKQYIASRVRTYSRPWASAGVARSPPAGRSARGFPIPVERADEMLERVDVSLSFEVGGAAMKPATPPTPGWILGIEFSPIFKSQSICAVV